MEKKIKIILKNNKCVESSTVFFLDWPENGEPSAKWMTTKCDQITFDSTVNWRGIGKIVVCCNDFPTNLSPPNLTETTYHNVALFKSVLQKYVRRQMSPQALQTALHLIKLDPDVFLRRIFVIMLEDVSLHTSISVIVWLTSAISKGFKLQSKHIEWLLGLTQYLCHNSHKTYLVHTRYEQNDISSIISAIDQSHFDSTTRDVIYSILFRFSYGGMHSDLNMFYWYALQLLDNKIPVYSENIIPVNLDKIQPLKVCDILPNGADFHCYPFFPSLVRKKFPQFTENDIKKCVWEYSSKINGRCPNDSDPHLMEIWATIETGVSELQRNLIRYHH